MTPMVIAIKLPDMGTTVDECKVLAWKVKEGDSVKRGDVLADIETDKAVAELESTAEGVLLQCRVPAGAMARTGDVLAYVGQAGESVIGERAAEQEVSASSAHQTEAPHQADVGTTPALARHPSSREEGSSAAPLLVQEGRRRRRRVVTSGLSTVNTDAHLPHR